MSFAFPVMQAIWLSLARQNVAPLIHALDDLPALPLWFRADAHVWPLWLDGVRPSGHLNPTSLWVEAWRVR